MPRSTKSYEERVEEMEKKEQASLEKARKYKARKRELEKKKNADESKKRTHRLCQVGATVESVLGRPIEEADIPKLTAFLRKQEERGSFFSRAMQREDKPPEVRAGESGSDIISTSLTGFSEGALIDNRGSSL